MSKTLAVIGSGKMAAIYADLAAKRNIRTVSFSNNEHDNVIGHCDKFVNTDIFDIDGIVRECRELNVGGVVCTTELTISPAAEIAERLGLNGLSPETAKNITNKGYVRRKASAVNGINQPKYFTADENTPIEWDIFPAIVKPTGLGGKRGITVVNNAGELKNAVSFAFDAITCGKKEIIIEEFMSGGTEYSVESLSYHGEHRVIQITRKISSGPPHCAELGHMQPAPLDGGTEEKIRKTIPELIAAAGIDNTATHIEIKIIGGEIYLVEINCRYGGDGISYPLTGLSTGFGYVDAGISIAMNDFEFPVIGKKQKHCGLLYVVKQTEFLEELFGRCGECDWLYKKHKVSNELVDLTNNDEEGTNYFIYLADEIPAEIAEILEKNNVLN